MTSKGEDEDMLLTHQNNNNNNHADGGRSPSDASQQRLEQGQRRARVTSGSTASTEGNSHHQNSTAAVTRQDFRPSDVLCGRGKESFNHVGNKTFREYINSSLQAYLNAPGRFEKSLVVHAIVSKVHSTDGRFLKQNQQTKQWYELTLQEAKNKVGHAVRDACNLKRPKDYQSQSASPSTSLDGHTSPPGTKSNDQVQHPSLNFHMITLHQNTTNALAQFSPFIPNAGNSATQQSQRTNNTACLSHLSQDSLSAIFSLPASLQGNGARQASYTSATNDASSFDFSGGTHTFDQMYMTNASQNLQSNLVQQQSLQPTSMNRLTNDGTVGTVTGMEGDDDQFLAFINTVLAPLDPDETDPLSNILL